MCGYHTASAFWLESYFRPLCGMFGNTLKRLFLKLLIIQLQAIFCLSVQPPILSLVSKKPQMNNVNHNNNNKKGRQGNPLLSSPRVSDCSEVTRRLMYSWSMSTLIFKLLSGGAGTRQEVGGNVEWSHCGSAVASFVF